MFSRKPQLKKHNFCKTNTKATNLADDVAVASLPDDWKPKHAGIIFTTYLDNRERNYTNLLGEMKCEARNLNDNIDIRLRNLIRIIISDIEEYELNIGRLIDKANYNNSSYDIHSHNETFKDLKILRMKVYDDITKFHHEALEIEEERSEILNNLLSMFIKRFIYLGYHSFEETEEEFNNYAYELKHQLSSNERSLLDLEFKLHNNITRLHIQGLLLLKQKKYKISINLSETELMNEQDEMGLEEQSIKVESADKVMFEDEINNCLSVMIKVYIVAVIEMFTAFYKKLHILNVGIEGNSLGNIEEDHALIELEEMIEEASQNLKNQTEQEYKVLEEIRMFGIELQESLHKIGKEVQEAHLILHEAVELFNRNMDRVNLVKRQTIAAIEDILTNQDSIEINSEVVFNITLENLRQTSDFDKTQLFYDTAIENLQQISNLYLSHKNIVSQKLEDCLQLIPIMSNTMITELELYLEKFPHVLVDSVIVSAEESLLKIPVFNKHIGNEILDKELSIEQIVEEVEQEVENEENSIQSITTCVSDKLSKALFEAHEQVKALRQWRNDFLTSIESNKEIIADEMLIQARHWVDKKLLYLDTRYYIKMGSHLVRKDRVKAVFNLRRSELEYHANRLKNHNLAVQNTIKKINSESTNCLSLDSPELYPFTYWMGDIENRINNLIADESDEEIKMLKSHSYSLRMQKYRKCFVESIEPAVSEVRDVFNQKIQGLRISNTAFIAGIQLFSEGGRYSAKEADAAIQTLTKNSDAIEVCANMVLDNINKIPSQLREEADNYVSHLSKILGYIPDVNFFRRPDRRFR